MTNCTVVATFTPNPEHLKEVRELLLEVAKEVRLEPGCLFYDLYDDVTGKLIFIEAWESRDLWQTHNDAPTVARILAFIDGKLTEPVLVQELYSAQ
jgi:quinol monooxygenase YgiN